MSGYLVPGVDADTKRLPVAVEEALATHVVAPAVADAAASKVDKGSLRINVMDYPGASSGAKAVAACAAAPTGSTVFFPPGIYVNPTGLGNGITVMADNVTIEMAQGAEIQCNEWGQPGIDLVGRSGCRVLGGVVRYTGTRGSGTTGNSGRASALYATGCGVFINKDRNLVQGLRTINMPVGIFLSAWATSTATDYRGVGNRIKDIEVEGANWGILWTAQKALTIDGLYFHDDIDDSSGTNPTHAIYCTSTDTFRSYGVTLSNLITEDCLYGQPYQIKYADNIVMTNLVARNSRGLLNVIGCVDLSLTGATATGCLVNLSPPAGAITVQGQGASRHRYYNVALESDQTAGYDQRLFVMDASDSTIDGLTVTSKRTSDTSNPIMQVRGLRNQVRNVTITETSGVAAPAVFVGGSGVDSTGTSIEGLRVSGCLRGVDLNGPATAVIGYVRDLVSTTSGTRVYVASGSPTYTLYEREATKPDIQTFTASGTWTKPVGYTVAEIVAIGGGAGGGSGRRGATGTVRCGGGGGSGGARSVLTIPLSALGSTVTVTIGAGGTGGAATTANDTNGSNGTGGGATIFGSFLRAFGGNAGSGGTASAGTGGGASVGGIAGGTGASASATGGTGGSSSFTGGAGQGGAAGGGITSADVASNGGAGFQSWSVGAASSAGGVVDTTTPVAANSAAAGVPTPGGAGGGGAASITTAAQAGTNGGNYGGGGSGGGASLNGNNSGAGGAGADGIVIVVCR